jgi:hypothetical protein
MTKPKNKQIMYNSYQLLYLNKVQDNNIIEHIFKFVEDKPKLFKSMALEDYTNNNTDLDGLTKYMQTHVWSIFINAEDSRRGLSAQQSLYIRFDTSYTDDIDELIKYNIKTHYVHNDKSGEMPGVILLYQDFIIIILNVKPVTRMTT